MKIEDVKIILDKEVYLVGERVTGKVEIKSQSAEVWAQHGRVLVKFYDDLNIEWSADDTLGINKLKKMIYSHKKKSYQVDMSTVLELKDAIKQDEVTYLYPFNFQLPNKLQGTINVHHAKCKYFIKCYLSDDINVYNHYSHDTNIFDEMFKKLHHTYCKKEVIVHNRTGITSNGIEQKKELKYEAKSNVFKVIITIPKTEFLRGETFKMHVMIDVLEFKELNEMFKVSFKIIQLVKLLSTTPSSKTRLFENLVSHFNRKHLQINTERGIILEEFILIPKDIPSTTTRSVDEVTIESGEKQVVNPIRINYKLSIEFWEYFYGSSLDINIPILVEPEI